MDLPFDERPLMQVAAFARSRAGSGGWALLLESISGGLLWHPKSLLIPGLSVVSSQNDDLCREATIAAFLDTHLLMRVHQKE